MTAPTSSAPTAPGGLVALDFWFDPRCPWAWLTSRWILEAATVRPIDPRFRVMSLSVLNENRDGVPHNDPESRQRGWGPVRTCVAAAEAYGGDVLGPLYTGLGTRIHVQGRQVDRSLVEEALTEVGLPEDLADAMTSEKYDDAVRASHQQAMDLVGDDVGTPVISFGGQAIFGPVVTPTPKGEAAGLLWDGVRLVMGTPGFYELKRSRLQAPTFD